MFWINFVAVNSAEQLRSVFLHWDGLHIHQRSLKEDCPRACIKRERSQLGNTSQNRSVFNINLFLPCHHAPPFWVAYTTSQEVQKVQKLFSCLPKCFCWLKTRAHKGACMISNTRRYSLRRASSSSILQGFPAFSGLVFFGEDGLFSAYFNTVCSVRITSGQLLNSINTQPMKSNRPPKISRLF